MANFTEPWNMFGSEATRVPDFNDEVLATEKTTSRAGMLTVTLYNETDSPDITTEAVDNSLVPWYRPILNFFVQNQDYVILGSGLGILITATFVTICCCMFANKRRKKRLLQKKIEHERKLNITHDLIVRPGNSYYDKGVKQSNIFLEAPDETPLIEKMEYDPQLSLPYSNDDTIEKGSTVSTRF